MGSPFQDLTPAQYSRISQLLDESIELAPAARDAWITDLGARDPEAADLLRRLFAARSESEAQHFLEDRDRIARLAAAAQAQPRLAGRQFGPYRVLSLLGHGGMGSVWLAERVDGLFNRKIALKLVHPALMGPMPIERLNREREILATLSHAHIARLLDAGFGEDGQPYLALEYVVGSPLTTYCDEHRLSISARLGLFRQILSAVQYAHAHGVIHRDLKPSNILVTEDGQAQLLDFGIAKLLTEGTAQETELTQLGGRVLTPDYAAPEQIAGAPISTAADVYSLGVVFYELLTAERPYRLKRSSRGALEEAILQAEPLAPSRAAMGDAAASARDSTPRKLAKALAGDLDTIALKALKKSPGERYATANAFDEDIARFERGDIVLAQPDSLAYRVRKFVRRHRLGIGVACALLAILAAGLAATGYEAKLAASQRDEALQAQQRLLTQTAATRLKAGDGHRAMAIVLEVLPQRGATPAYTPEALNAFEGARAADASLLAFAGHTERVNYATFSPDGTRVVTASNDNSGGIWDVATGRQLLRLIGHTAPLSSAEFSPDGRRVVTAAIDGSARVWDAASGRELLALRGQGDHINTATYSADGLRILTSSDDGAAYLWDAATGTLIHRFAGHSDRVSSAMFSPDGRHIVTASEDKTTRIWDVASGRVLRVLAGHTDRAWFAQYSPDGAHIVTASYDKTARIWDAATGETLVQLVGHAAPVSTAMYSADGRYIVTSSADMTARIWEVASGRLVRVLSGHTDRVWCAQFAPDGRRVVTSSDDRTARIWEVEPRGQIQLLRGHVAPVNAAHFSTDGKQVVTASDDMTARVWDAASGRELRAFTGHTAPIPSAAISPDGLRIATASNDHTARVWEIASGREIARFTGHDNQVVAVAFSNDGERAVTGGIDHTARVWNAASGRQLAVLVGHTDIVSSVAFSPDDTRVLTAGDQTARIWDAVSGRQLLVLQGHSGEVWTAAFSPDGKQVLTASTDHTARLWDAASGQELERLSGLTDNVPSAGFSPDGRRAVVAVDDHTARIWELVTGRQILAFAGHEDMMQFASFAPDGERIVTASDDGTARIWDVHTPPLEIQIAWAAAAQFDPLPSTERYALGLPIPQDVRVWQGKHSACDDAAAEPEDPDRHAAGVPAPEIVTDVAVAACARASASPSGEARAHFEYARALLAAGQSGAARSELEKAVSQNYRAARVELARVLAQSASEVQRAVSLDEVAWKSGVVVAAFELGNLYEHGVHASAAGGADPLLPDQAAAWRWYEQGANALEPHALARFGEREDVAAAVSANAVDRDRHWLAAFQYYATAAERARREDWPDGIWRNWRFRRASLAHLLALDGKTAEVATAFDAVRASR